MLNRSTIRTSMYPNNARKTFQTVKKTSVCWAPIQFVLILKTTSVNYNWESDYRLLVLQVGNTGL